MFDNTETLYVFGMAEEGRENSKAIRQLESGAMKDK